MRPKLKENPREWLKFTLAMTVALAILSTLLWRKKHFSATILFGVLAVLAMVALLCLARPTLFRPFYRAGMTVGFYIGQVVGRILLTIFFFIVLTPFGLVLRLLGKDLLKMKRNRGASSYWQPSKKFGHLDRQF